MKRPKPNGLLKPDAGVAVAMLASVIVFIFGGQLAYRTYFHMAADSWERVPATVTGIINHPKSATLNYSYSFKGQSFTGDRYEYFRSGTVPEKAKINERFQIGDTLLIRVDPQKPSRSVVQRNPVRLEQMSTHLFVIGFALVATAAVFIRKRVTDVQIHREPKTTERC